MKLPSPKIRPESSALGMKMPTSPLLTELIAGVMDIRRESGLRPARLVMEYGCGLLRNLRELRRHFPQVCLVDTELQLTRFHDFGGKRMTVPEYVRRHYRHRSVITLTDRQFEASRLVPDVVFSVNVMDVIPPETRRAMLANVCEHLSTRGQFALLVPRNDSRTMNLCKGARTYRDGHLFSNHGAFTYYRNWLSDELQRFCRLHGFDVVHDLSRYRYCCFACQLKKRRKRKSSGKRPTGAVSTKYHA
jgi:hypothetical protein